MNEDDVIQFQEDVAFGICAAQKLGGVEKSVAMYLAQSSFGPQGHTDELTTAVIAQALKLTEERVFAALKVLQAKGLMRLTFHPQMTALIELGADLRQSLARLQDGAQR